MKDNTNRMIFLFMVKLFKLCSLVGCYEDGLCIQFRNRFILFKKCKFLIYRYLYLEYKKKSQFYFYLFKQFFDRNFKKYINFE